MTNSGVSQHPKHVTYYKYSQFDIGIPGLILSRDFYFKIYDIPSISIAISKCVYYIERCVLKIDNGIYGEMRMRTTLIKRVLFVLMSLAIFAACDEIIENITSVDIGLTEDLYTGPAQAGFEYIVINQSVDLTKTWPDLNQVIMVPLPPDVDMVELAEAGVLVMNARMQNDNAHAVHYSFYFGSSSELTRSDQAVFIGSAFLSGGEAVTFSGFEPFDENEQDVIRNMVQFFSQNPGITMFYLYIAVEPASDVKKESIPVRIKDLTNRVAAEIINFQASPFWQATQEIMPDTDYQSYGTGIEAVRDIELTGYVKNNGAGSASLVFEVAPKSSESWSEGVVARINAISPGDSLVLDDMEGLIANQSLLEGAFETLTVNSRSIFATLTITSATDLNVFMDIGASYVVTITK